jgi:hypothetical protein
VIHASTSPAADGVHSQRAMTPAAARRLMPDETPRSRPRSACHCMFYGRASAGTSSTSVMGPSQSRTLPSSTVV